MTIHHQHHGQGEPGLVFIHGFLCHLEHWRHQSEYFRHRTEVLAVDLLGHGQTMAKAEDMNVETVCERLAALIQEKMKGRVILVGHSMGCRIALRTAQMLNERCVGLILVDGSKQGNDPDIDPQAFVDKVHDMGFVPFAQHTFNMMFYEPRFDYLKREILDYVVGNNPDLVVPLFKDVRRFDAVDAQSVVASLKQPILVIQSTDILPDGQRVALDGTTHGVFADFIAQHGQDVTITLLPGGHFTMMEQPANTNYLMDQFRRIVGKTLPPPPKPAEPVDKTELTEASKEKPEN